MRGEPGAPGVKGIAGPPGKAGPLGNKGDKGSMGVADEESAKKIAGLENKITLLEKSLSWLQNVVLLQHEKTISGKKLYVYVKNKADFPSALSLCGKYGGILPSPKSDKENAILYNLATDTGGAFYLGINDRDIEGQFVDGDGIPIIYKNWYGKEPNGFTKENCVLLYQHGQWIDLSCDQTKSVVCEFSIP